MVPSVDDQHPLAALARQPFGNDAARKAGPDDKPIKHR
jgi:hypothetical protein